MTDKIGRTPSSIMTSSSFCQTAQLIVGHMSSNRSKNLTLIFEPCLFLEVGYQHSVRDQVEITKTCICKLCCARLDRLRSSHASGDTRNLRIQNDVVHFGGNQGFVLFKPGLEHEHAP